MDAKSHAKSITDIVGSLYLFEIILFVAGLYLFQAAISQIAQGIAIVTLLFALVSAFRQKTVNNEVFKK